MHGHLKLSKVHENGLILVVTIIVQTIRNRTHKLTVIWRFRDGNTDNNANMLDVLPAFDGVLHNLVLGETSRKDRRCTRKEDRNTKKGL